jgi:amino acid transporter
MAATSATRAQDQAAQEAAAPPPLLFHPNEVLVWIVIVLVLAFILLALAWLRNAMTKSTWSLADALSEEADVAYFTASGTPQTDTSGKPVTVSEMRASSSRLIALLGAIVILFLFLGFGAFVLYQYGTTGGLPDVSKILAFMSGGLALFAPYAVNKISSLGSS